MGDLGCSYQAAAIGAGVDDAGEMEEVGMRSSGHFTNTNAEKERRKYRNLKPRRTFLREEGFKAQIC